MTYQMIAEDKEEDTQSPCPKGYRSAYAYLVERGLILKTHQVDKKTNEIKALPELIESLALNGVVFAFDAINTQKNYCHNY